MSTAYFAESFAFGSNELAITFATGDKTVHKGFQVMISGEIFINLQ